MAELEPAEDYLNTTGIIRRKISQLLNGKEQEWTSLARRTGPLQLLDLPVDILKEIVKEITHTNDLTALALTHSALHNLAIPHIYSRFDIVWPDASTTSENRTGVDALTYGLSTLVMDPMIFGSEGTRCHACGGVVCTKCQPLATLRSDASRGRFGNLYPQFTRKFSLGNGPADWIQEYLISKESGKMLGTLVALAVARMINLEAFVWDMPTGVLRDVWRALSSLQFKHPNGESRLEKVLVRWHDNSAEQTTPPSQSTPLSPNIPSGSTVTSIGILLSSPEVVDEPASLESSARQTGSMGRQTPVESPTLSILPPLKSLSVLDIDEISYLDEMSILVAKSALRLRELRVGIARRARFRDFVLSWDGDFEQVDHERGPGMASRLSDRRLGGVLGVIVGRLFDIRKRTNIGSSTESSSTESSSTPPDQTMAGINVVATGIDTSVSTSQHKQAASKALDVPSATPWLDQAFTSKVVPSEQQRHITPFATSQIASDPSEATIMIHQQEQLDTRKSIPNVVLKLQTLELERVPLSVAVLQRAFDWSVLTSLTILDCAYHENLWRMLRRQFSPKPHRISVTDDRPKTSLRSTTCYQLNLKRIHTDVTTPALIAFIKETLAPHTLETLFLQDRRKSSNNSVTVDSIFRGPLKRHHRSLKRLLLDSSEKLPGPPTSNTDNSRPKIWMMTHEVLAFITSGNMTSLKELSVVIDYKDWHFFLRRLPRIPTLRSLNIPCIIDHVTPAYDPRELALQVVDVICLSPVIELCYLGISHKCFEILETCASEEAVDLTRQHETADEVDEDQTMDDEDDEDGDEAGASEEEAEEDVEAEGPDGVATATEAVEADASNAFEMSDQDEADEEVDEDIVEERDRISLKLREILFYDDRVQIFKARHMRL